MADTPDRFRAHESRAFFHGTKADPNVTDKKFRQPAPLLSVLRTSGGHPGNDGLGGAPPEYLRQFRAGLEALQQRENAVLYN